MHVLVRTDQEVLVGGTEDVLSAQELGRFRAGVHRLSAVLARVDAKGGPRTLLREDVKALVEQLAPAPAPTRATGRAPRNASVIEGAAEPTEDPKALVEAEVQRLADPALKLVSIPDVVRALRHQLGPAEVHRALFALDTEGVIELRPDAGSEFLRPEDAQLCPQGPRDTVLSRARVRDASSPPVPAPPAGSFQVRFDAAFGALDQASVGHNDVTLRALREALPDVPRATFDAGLSALRRARLYTLNPSDGRHRQMTAAERDAGILEGNSLLVYVARISDAPSLPRPVRRDLDDTVLSPGQVAR